jgi:RNA-binding protein YlmH
MLENVSSKGHVRVNGKTLDKDSDIVLMGGDEVVFSSTGRHAYVSFFSLQVTKLVILLFMFVYHN